MKNRPNHTDVYFCIAIIILVIGIIAGMIIGAASMSDNEVSGILLMIYIWSLTGLLDIFIFAIYSICHRLDLLIDKKN